MRILDRRADAIMIFIASRQIGAVEENPMSLIGEGQVNRFRLLAVLPRIAKKNSHE
jgi:hypothetical protein